MSSIGSLFPKNNETIQKAYHRVNALWCPSSRKLTPRKVKRITANPIMAITADRLPLHPIMSLP
jgi:hypothetical protein